MTIQTIVTSALGLNLGTLLGVPASVALTDALKKCDNNFIQLFDQTPVSVTVTGAYQGTWNATTNSPAIASGTGTQGYYYIVNVAGSTVIDGISTWTVGDWIIFNGAQWSRVPASYINSDVNATSGPAEILNNPIILTDKYYVRDLTLGPNEIFYGIIDSGSHFVSGVYIDGTVSEPITAYVIDSSEPWYAGYSEIDFAIVDNGGGAAFAQLASGQSLADFMRFANPFDNGNTIICLGDSLTQRGYPADLATLTGRPVINLGVGSQVSNQIAARMGAISVAITLSSNTLTVGSNSITEINGVVISGGNGNQGLTATNQFLSRADSNTSLSAMGTLGSVHGTMTRTATGGPPSTSEVYTFVPDNNAVLPAGCPPGTPFVADYPYTSLTHVIWAGSNDIYAGLASQVLQNVTAIQNKLLAAANSKFIILNPINQTQPIGGDTSSILGGDNWNLVMAAEESLATLALGDFVNIRRLLIDQGLSIAGLTATPTDTTDIANDCIPAQLKADTTHQTAEGDIVVATLIQRALAQRGY